MWLAVELVFHHYEPDKFKASTLFMNVHYPGTDKEHVEVFPLGSVALELWEKNMIIPESFGYPVQPHILDDNNRIIAFPEEIGQFDHPLHEDEYQPFTYKEMNIIMQDFDGLCEILIDPDEYEQENFIQPEYVDDLVVIRGLTPDEEEDDMPDYEHDEYGNMVRRDVEPD